MRHARRRTPQTLVPQQPAQQAGTAQPLPLPHERDQRTDAPVAVKAAPKQAAQDLAAGQVDTDNYTRTLDNNRAAAETPKR